MKKYHVIMTTMSASMIGMLGVFAMAQTSAPEGSTKRVDPRTGESTTQPYMRAGHMGGDMEGMMAEMPPDMVMRCRMLLNTVVSPSDPSAILALKDQLKLTSAQTTQLEAINREARDKAAALLNADQKVTLAAMPQSPKTMKDMHEQLVAQMQKMRGEAMGDRPMNCPLMQMMQEQAGPGTQPTTGEPAAEMMPATPPTPRNATMQPKSDVPAAETEPHHTIPQ